MGIYFKSYLNINFLGEFNLATKKSIEILRISFGNQDILAILNYIVIF